MKWSGVLLAIGIMLVFAAPAAADLSKADARLAAEGEVLDFRFRQGWADDSSLGSCSRISARRVDCKASVSGRDFQSCDYYGDQLLCVYEVHFCRLKVKVVEAGYGTAERIISQRCDPVRVEYD